MLSFGFSSVFIFFANLQQLQCLIHSRSLFLMELSLSQLDVLAFGPCVLRHTWSSMP
jgi:hypothetical protein